jgi:hypothetical protein
MFTRFGQSERHGGADSFGWLFCELIELTGTTGLPDSDALLAASKVVGQTTGF